MRACALSSGSSGNCFYIEKNNSAVLFDVGISAKKVVERMNLLNLNPENIKAVFVTHEHTDHIIGLDVFARKFNLPIFATRGTISNGHLCSDNKLLNEIKNNSKINIGELEIETFTKSHKAADPVSFSVYNQNKVVSVITDAGYACKNINNHIAESNLLFLESNHDVKMVENGPYPYFLKKWVTSDSGHLSNTQAGLAVLEHGNKKLKNVVLSHISKTNNSPRIALKTFRNLLKERNDFTGKVSVSLDYCPTEMFSV
jgi:phosphoribosyl 1,2-cyclic phosphodiesterase